MATPSELFPAHRTTRLPDGKFKGFTIAKWLSEMVCEYYQLSGRHDKTGRPFMDTLNLLGLEEFSEWAQLD